MYTYYVCVPGGGSSISLGVFQGADPGFLEGEVCVPGDDWSAFDPCMCMT